MKTIILKETKAVPSKYPLNKLAKVLSLNMKTYSGEPVAYADPAFQAQRGDDFRWSLISMRWFIQSVFLQANLTSIVLVDVKSSLEYAKRRNKSADIKYFSKLDKKGIKFLIVDGANRINTLTKYLMSMFSLDKPFQLQRLDGSRLDIPACPLEEMDEKIKDFFMSREVPITVIQNCTRKDCSEYFRRVNAGLPLNDPEYRNSFETPIAHLVRKIADFDFENHPSLISSKMSKRRKYDDFIATLLAYYCYGLSHQYNKNLKLAMYDIDIINDNDPVSNSSSFEKFYRDFVNTIGENNLSLLHKFNYTSVLDLFIFLKESKESGLYLNKVDAQNFFEKWSNVIAGMISDQDKLYTIPLGQVTYKRLQQSLFDRDMNQKRYEEHLKIAGDKGWFDDYFTSKDSKRAFTAREKALKAAEQQFLDPITGEKMEITEDFLSDYHGDHIVPHSKGGETAPSNLQVTKGVANQAKSDSVA